MTEIEIEKEGQRQKNRETKDKSRTVGYEDRKTNRQKDKKTKR